MLSLLQVLYQMLQQQQPTSAAAAATAAMHLVPAAH